MVPLPTRHDVLTDSPRLFLRPTLMSPFSHKRTLAPIVRVVQCLEIACPYGFYLGEHMVSAAHPDRASFGSPEMVGELE